MTLSLHSILGISSSGALGGLGGQSALKWVLNRIQESMPGIVLFLF